MAALRDGHAEAAQALLASLIDTMLRRHFTKDLFRKVTDNKKHKPPIDVDDFTIRVALVVAPIWAAYSEFWDLNGGPIPTMFARHASAHAVSKRQFTRVNAVIALTVTASLLWLLDRDGKSRP